MVRVSFGILLSIVLMTLRSVPGSTVHVNRMGAERHRHSDTHCTDSRMTSYRSGRGHYGETRSNMGQSAPFGDDLSLTYLFDSTSEKKLHNVTNYMLCILLT